MVKKRWIKNGEIVEMSHVREPMVSVWEKKLREW